jgi:CHAT domain-containing protein
MPRPDLAMLLHQGFGNPLHKWTLFCALLCVALLSASLNVYSADLDLPQNQEDLLSANQTVERGIANSEVHRFRVRLGPNQFVHFVLDQKNVDLTIEVFQPDRQSIADANSPYGNQGLESISFVAEAAGEYSIEVRPVKGNLLAGRYSLQAQGFRPPQAGETTRIKAERLLRAGQKLFEQNTPDGWEQAIAKYQEAIRDWRDLGDQQEEVKSLYLLGEAYRRWSKFQNAVDFYNQSLKLAQQIKAHRAEAYAWMQLGHTYLYFDQHKARDASQQAWEQWKALRDRANEATALHNLSGAYDNLGEWQQAYSYCEQVIALRRELADWRGVASTLNNLGIICDKLGRSHEALHQYNEALSILNQMSNLTQSDRRKIAALLNNIGYLYATLGDTALAMDYYEQALPIRKETYDVSGEGSTLLNIGHIYTKIGKPRDALIYYEKARQTTKLLQSEWGEAYCLLYAGQAYVALDDRQQALTQYVVALDSFRKFNDPQAEATVLDEIAAIFAAQGKAQAARENYDRALAIWRTVRDPHGEAAALYGLAQLERSQGNFATAHIRAVEAIKVVEGLRTKVIHQTLKASYLSTVRDYYDLDIEVLMQLHRQHPSEGYDKRACEISEQGRARSFLESLAEIGKEIREGVDVALLERERTLLGQIEAKSQKQIKLNSEKQAEEQIKTVEKELGLLVARHKELQEEIRAKSPAYAALTQPQPLSLKEIQQQVLDPDTLLLEYALGEERSYLWLVSQTAIESFELPKRSVIEASAKKVYAMISTRELDGKESGERFWQEITTLSKMILSPIEAKLAEKRLLIVAEGALQYVPFAALPIEGGDHRQRVRGVGSRRAILLEKHEIIALPSASVMAVLRRELQTRKQPEKRIAVFADPVYSREDERLTFANSRSPDSGAPVHNRSLARAIRDWSAAGGRWNLYRLKDSEREAEEIQTMVNPEASRFALGFQASLANVIKSDLSKYRIIHFATHGLFNNEHPDLSGIVLSLINEKGEAQDGFLRLNDVYNLKLSADLVVLSACETALGSNIRGEGIVGLTRGFMYAGTARVMASLWKVDDQQTAELMKRFYKRLLKENFPPSKALRLAQLEMWQRERKSSPYHWAAFVLQGEWR